MSNRYDHLGSVFANKAFYVISVLLGPITKGPIYKGIPDRYDSQQSNPQSYTMTQMPVLAKNFFQNELYFYQDNIDPNKKNKDI